MSMEKGDIVWATKDKDKHPHAIVFLEKINDYSFKSAILSSKKVNKNIKMHSEYICKVDNNGNEYDFKYKNTHLISIYSFEKAYDWVKGANIVGRLTDEGIEFVENNISKISIFCPMSIKEFVEQQSSQQK